MSNKKGITLIALVLTIIVLLLLSGIRIVMEVNDKGLISKAEQVRMQNELQEIIEKCERLKVFDNSNLIDVEKTAQNIQENFENVKINEDENECTIVIKKEYATHSFTIDKKGIVLLNQIPASAGEAYAIIVNAGTDKYEMIFTRSDTVLKVGDTYKGKNIQKVYTDFENTKYLGETESQPEWRNFEGIDKIEKVSFNKIIKPISTARWFYKMKNCTTIDITNLDTQNVTNMKDMFHTCEQLNKIKGLSKLKTSNVTNMTAMFKKCKGLLTLDLSSFDTLNVTNMSSMFFECSNLVNLDLTNFNTSNVTDMYAMFYKCGELVDLDLTNFDTSNVTKMDSMFSECLKLENLDLTSFDTSNVIGMEYMFKECGSLESLDLTNFDTSSVTNMHSMFNACSNLVNLDLTNFKTSNVTDMYAMFFQCEKLVDLDLTNFDTSNVTNMDSMFSECLKLENLDLIKFDTSKVTDMEFMFYKCRSLESLDLTNFDTSSVTNMHSMFYECNSLNELKISSEKFITSKVEKMEYMFAYCGKLNLNCSNWNINNVKEYIGFNFEASGVIEPTWIY